MTRFNCTKKHRKIDRFFQTHLFVLNFFLIRFWLNENGTEPKHFEFYNIP